MQPVKTSPIPPWLPEPGWPCKWISIAGPLAQQRPIVVAYRCVFELAQPRKAALQVSADERYRLYLDGQAIGTGSERGDRNTWYYETHEVDLPAGRHSLVALVWSLGKLAPWAQMTVRHGLIVACRDEAMAALLGTGVAAWQAKPIGGLEFTSPGVRLNTSLGVGAEVTHNAAAFPWEFAAGAGDNWQAVETLYDGYEDFYLLVNPSLPIMRKAILPQMRMEPMTTMSVHQVDQAAAASQIVDDQNLPHEQLAWQELCRTGAAVTVPPRTARRIIVNLGDYYCFYPQLQTSGGAGAAVTITYAEAARDADRHKIRRDQLSGGFIRGLTDTFLPAGPSRRFEPLWWRSGRYMEINITTADEPLVVEQLGGAATGYPLTMDSSCQAPADIAGIMRLCWRSIQSCAHETYMDCPHYEQLMYVGDTRLQMLTTFACCLDARLPRKAVELFERSRMNYTGMIVDAYPTPQAKLIAPFAMWWVAMVHDFAWWRACDDASRKFVRSMLPAARGVLDQFVTMLDADGLMVSPPGWNYADLAWHVGIPPGGLRGQRSGVLNWQLALTFEMAAQLEDAYGESEMAQRWRRHARQLHQAIDRVYWSAARQCYADDEARQLFSEHSQCLAILSGLLDPQRVTRLAEVLLNDADLARTNIYFSHYLFDTYHRIGRSDKIIERMDAWRYLEAQGFKTTPERFGEARSECHAWGAHPLFHVYASLLGIRPDAPGFERVRIQLDARGLGELSGSMIHPRGKITVACRRGSGKMRVEVDMPPGVCGTLVLAGQSRPIGPGRTTAQADVAGS